MTLGIFLGDYVCSYVVEQLDGSGEMTPVIVDSVGSKHFFFSFYLALFTSVI